MVIEREFHTATVHQGYIEPHNATALWNADGSVTIWCSTQGAFTVRAQVAELLQSFGWAEDRVFDLGDITAARGPEMYLPLWLRMFGALGTGNFNIGIVRGD